jgi:hypothetical protein
MKRPKLTKEQQAELNRVASFIATAADWLEDSNLRHMTTAKILSRVACFADRLTDLKFKDDFGA